MIMQGSTTGWALLLSDHDHRPQTVAKKIASIRELKLPSARIVEVIGPLRQVFGHQGYHLILKLEAAGEDELLEAFEALEHSFSHVDGFI
jgi:hypothetical protein